MCSYHSFHVLVKLIRIRSLSKCQCDSKALIFTDRTKVCKLVSYKSCLIAHFQHSKTFSSLRNGLRTQSKEGMYCMHSTYINTTGKSSTHTHIYIYIYMIFSSVIKGANSRAWAACRSGTGRAALFVRGTALSLARSCGRSLRPPHAFDPVECRSSGKSSWIEQTLQRQKTCKQTSNKSHTLFIHTYS